MGQTEQAAAADGVLRAFCPLGRAGLEVDSGMMTDLSNRQAEQKEDITASTMMSQQSSADWTKQPLSL